jgi:hypothetical protein
MDKQYAVLAHSVSFEFYPAMAEAKEEVLRSNPSRFPNAEIVYLGWASGFNDKTSKKSSSSLIIAFGDPRHANQAIQEGIFLRGALVRTELYDPGCRVVQCSRCYRFGHVAAMCSSTAACPYCTLAMEGNNFQTERIPPDTNAPFAKVHTPPTVPEMDRTE